MFYLSIHCPYFRQLPEELTESVLTMEDVPLILTSWKYAAMGPHIEELIKLDIANYPTVCLRTRSGSAVGWFIGQRYGALGMLHVLPEFRGRGLARYLVTTLARKVLDSGGQAFVCIEQGNDASLKLHEKCGFTVCDHICWLLYQPGSG